MSPRRTSTDDPNQLLINWSARVRPPHAATPATPVLVLPWDFTSTFPQPLDEAIDAGVIDVSDTTAEGLRSLHDEYRRQAIETLRAHDTFAQARRRGVDPTTGNRLVKSLAEAPERQDHAFDVLMLTYRDAFGDQAAEAFAKAIRARHAGVEVSAGSRSGIAIPPTSSAPSTSPDAPMSKSVAARSPAKRRTSTGLPVPKPLPSAVAAGHFGHDDGAPIRPGRAEVRAITEQHADRMIELLHEMNVGGTGREPSQSRYAAALSAYAESFGQAAADRLDAHVRHEAAKQPARGYGR